MPRKSSIIDSKNTEEKLKKPRLSKKDKTVTIATTDAAISTTETLVASLAATPATTPATTLVASPETISSPVTNIVKPKRGRKSKSELMALLNNTNTNMLQLHVDESSSAISSSSSSSNEIVSEVSDIKNEIIQQTSVTESVEAEVEEDIDLDAVVDDNKKVIKKRGRKPKGGKIIQNIVINETQKVDKPNVILHLKCSLKDLQSSSSCLIESYNFNSNELGYDIITKNDNVKAPKVIKDTTMSITTTTSGTGASSLINDIKGFNIVANTNTNSSLVKDRDLDLSRNNYSKYSNYDNEDDDYDDDEDDDDYSDNNKNNNNKKKEKHTDWIWVCMILWFLSYLLLYKF